MDRATDIGPLWGQNTPDSAWTRFGIDAAYVVVYLNLGFDKSTAPKQNLSVKKAPVIQTNKSKEPTIFPTTDHFPTCVGPNIHGGAEAWRAGRLDVLDLFASFWIKPKRRRTVAPENRLVKEAPVNSFKQKQRTDALPNSRQLSYVRWPEHPRGSGGLAG
jgi:hypothetical protein